MWGLMRARRGRSGPWRVTEPLTAPHTQKCGQHTAQAQALTQSLIHSYILTPIHSYIHTFMSVTKTQCTDKHSDTVPLIDDDDLFCKRFSGPDVRACGEECPCGSHEGVG